MRIESKGSLVFSCSNGGGKTGLDSIKGKSLGIFDHFLDLWWVIFRKFRVLSDFNTLTFYVISIVCKFFDVRCFVLILLLYFS